MDSRRTRLVSIGLLLFSAIGCARTQSNHAQSKKDAGASSSTAKTQKTHGAGLPATDASDRTQHTESTIDAAAFAGPDAGVNTDTKRDAASTTSPDAAAPVGDAALTHESACSPIRQATPALPTLFLLIDGSDSMQMPFPPSPDAGVAADAGMLPTRWSAVRDALVGAQAGIVGMYGRRVKFGLAIFGTQMTCPLPLGTVAPAFDNLAAISAAWPSQGPGLFTPTGLALSQIVDMLEDPSVADVGPQVVLLATDGDPNTCNLDPLMALTGGTTTDYGPSIEAAQKLQQKHQQMFVVGVGSDASKAHLQEMANLGAGLARDANPAAEVFYPATASELRAAFESAVERALSCDVAFDGPAIAAGSECAASVTLNGQQLACNADDGWVLRDGNHFRLQGKACAALKASPDASVAATVPCPK